MIGKYNTTKKAFFKKPRRPTNTTRRATGTSREPPLTSTLHITTRHMKQHYYQLPFSSHNGTFPTTKSSITRHKSPPHGGGKQKPSITRHTRPPLAEANKSPPLRGTKALPSEADTPFHCEALHHEAEQQVQYHPESAITNQTNHNKPHNDNNINPWHQSLARLRQLQQHMTTLYPNRLTCTS